MRLQLLKNRPENSGQNALPKNLDPSRVVLGEQMVSANPLQLRKPQQTRAEPAEASYDS